MSLPLYIRARRPNGPMLYTSRVGSHWAQDGKSLHTINVETETLTTLRDLRLKHQPSLHTSTPVSHALGDITIAPKTGEFVHLGEREAWKR